MPVKPKANEAFLIVEEGKLGMAGENWPKEHPVFVDFNSGASEHRRLHGGGAGQAVVKATGLNKRPDMTVLDATAGLGRDAYVLASLGANVHMLERNPAVQQMLLDGLDRLSMVQELTDIYHRLSLSFGSLSTGFKTEELGEVDVVYLDPMFPDRAKSAKVKKDMALFHHVVGVDLDADDLLGPAMDLAVYRTVVKRPKNAPFLAGKTPTTSLTGKSNRFDIYSKKAIK